jgi:PPM family protein phosphatase
MLVVSQLVVKLHFSLTVNILKVRVENKIVKKSSPRENPENRQLLLINSASLTSTGMVRIKNEDRLFALDRRERNRYGAESFGIYLIADGMGGHQSGEVASQMACQTISQFLMDNLKDESEKSSPELLVKQSIENANQQIFRLASTSQKHYSMGTTIALGFRLDNKLYLGHAGDSRAYLIRKAKIHQLTEDHSLTAHLIKNGLITANEAKYHPARGKIFRFLGGAEIIKLHITSLTLLAGDDLIFCSDGLTLAISDSEILKLVRDSKDADQACKSLVDLANIRGGEDNSSLVVVKFIPIEKVVKGC